MQEIKVIIGASYGDEGKGLATDYFGARALRKNTAGSGGLLIPGPAPSGTCGTINVLTNGGPQRGHTVELSDGRRHVFKHFGSASFRGAVTYFDRHFIVNPMEFIREFKELCEEHAAPHAFIHPECRFTTPWDMLVNQLLQEKRGTRNSCGFGIWETVLRYQRGWGIPFGHFAKINPEDRGAYLRRLRDYYFTRRIREILDSPRGEEPVIPTAETAGFDVRTIEPVRSELAAAENMRLRLSAAKNARLRLSAAETTRSKLPTAETARSELPGKGAARFVISITEPEIEIFKRTAPVQEYFYSDGLLSHFATDCESMCCVCPIQTEKFLKQFQTVLFENGQGLLLDGNRQGEHIYTTPSTTGVGTVFRTIENVFEHAQVEVCYVTRSYLTRHGEGSMEDEISPSQLGKLLPEVREDRTNIENCFQGSLRYGMINTDLLADRISADFARCGRAVANRIRPSVMITHLNEYTGIDTDLLAERFGTVYLSDGRTEENVTTGCRADADINDAETDIRPTAAS